MAYRYRIAVDVAFEEPLTNRQEARLGDLMATLAKTVGADDIEVDAEIKTVNVATVHNHESSEDYSCDYCRRQLAGDTLNSQYFEMK